MHTRYEMLLHPTRRHSSETTGSAARIVSGAEHHPQRDWPARDVSLRDLSPATASHGAELRRARVRRDMPDADRNTGDGRHLPEGMSLPTAGRKSPSGLDEGDERLLEAARNLKAYLTILREWAYKEAGQVASLQYREVPKWLLDLDLRE